MDLGYGARTPEEALDILQRLIRREFKVEITVNDLELFLRRHFSTLSACAHIVHREVK